MSPLRRSPALSVQFSRFGGVEVLDLVEVERPTAGPGEIVVEVMAAGINHVEAWIREGRYGDEFPVDFPQTQGTDLAGIVVAVGEGVTRFRRGTEVVGHAPMSSHAHFVVLPQNNVVVKPAALSWEAAGGLFLAGVAAWEGLQAVHVARGETVVISAAAGGVGSMQAHLARYRGATVIGTCGERNFDYLRNIGVLPVVYGDGLADRINALAPKGVSAYIDNFGQDNVDVAQALGVSPSRFRSSDHRKQVELASVRPTAERAAENTRILAQIAPLAASRAVDVLISGFYPFENIRDAFDDLEKHHARGKIVLGMRPVNAEFHGLGGRKLREEHERAR